MGRDIHIHMEQKNEFGEWENILYPEHLENRSSRRFSVMDDIFEHNGIPDDVAQETRKDFEYWDCGYCPGHLTIENFDSCEDCHLDILGDFMDYMKEHPGVRMVYWYDS